MRVALYDNDRRHTRWVELPDTIRPPQVIMIDGIPYVAAEDAATYRLAAGVHHTFSEEPSIDMAKKFDRPVVAEANSTRWFSGCVGEAKMLLSVDIESPWMESMKLSVTTTRTIRIHGVWSADCEDKALHETSVHARRKLLSECRRAVNQFCCEWRPPNSKLMLTMMGVDVNGRLVCEIHKHMPAIGQVPVQVLSLRKHLLGTGLFTPAKWRLP